MGVLVRKVRLVKNSGKRQCALVRRGWSCSNRRGGVSLGEIIPAAVYSRVEMQFKNGCIDKIIPEILHLHQQLLCRCTSI